MKKIVLILAFLIIGSSLFGCNKDNISLKDGSVKNDTSIKDGGTNNDISVKDGTINNADTEDNNIEYSTFEAEIIESDGALLIAPDKDSVEYSSSDRISVAVMDADIIDDKGNASDVEMLKPGDIIRISYNGLIAESYPAQITADKIELIGHNYVVDGFLTLIDDLYQEDSGLNGGISMIAFNTTKWTMLSETETDTILAMVKKEYGFEVIEGTFDELAEQGLIDKENLYFEKGILIEISDIEINKDKD